MKEREKEFIIPPLSCRKNDKEYVLHPDSEEKVLSFILLRENKSVHYPVIIPVHKYGRSVQTSTPWDHYLLQFRFNYSFPSRWWDVDRAFALPSTLSPPPVPVDAGHSRMRHGLRPRPDVAFFFPFVPVLKCEDVYWRELWEEYPQRSVLQQSTNGLGGQWKCI